MEKANTAEDPQDPPFQECILKVQGDVDKGYSLQQHHFNSKTLETAWSKWSYLELESSSELFEKTKQSSMYWYEKISHNIQKQKELHIYNMFPPSKLLSPKSLEEQWLFQSLWEVRLSLSTLSMFYDVNILE